MSGITYYEGLIVQSKLPKKIEVCSNFSTSNESFPIKAYTPPYKGTNNDLYSSVTVGSVLMVENAEQSFVPIKCLKLTYEGKILFKGVPPYVGVSFSKYLIATVDENKKVTLSSSR